VAKILVADDNSNIQKMVGLALKDQGIDVVAVGNGEAAVRKISDVRPDLVLADVFMPVRNGYEVCSYVKQDSALSHIPVILLVGAFDPLDEQEAQRVGADGVLKKPFVPPDPLISMVKSALTRAGVVIGAQEPAAAPAPAPVANAKPAPLTGPAIVPNPSPANDADSEPSLPVFAKRPAPLTIDKADQPLAFGSLLGSPAQEEEPVFAVPSSTPAPDRDWGQNAEPEEEEEEDSKSASWRVSSMDELPDEAPAGQQDWREVAFAGIGAEKGQKEWAPSVEKNSLSITEEEAAELAKSQEAVPAGALTTGTEDWSKAISSLFPDKSAAPEAPYAPASSAATTTATVDSLPSWPEPSLPVTTSEPVLAASTSLAPAEPEVPSAAAEEIAPPPPASIPEPAPALNSWMAGAVSPWESELQRAADLASSWDTTKLTSPEAEPEPASIESHLESLVPQTDATEATQAFLKSDLMAATREQVVQTIEETKVTAPQSGEDEFVRDTDVSDEPSAYSSVPSELEARYTPAPVLDAQPEFRTEPPQATEPAPVEPVVTDSAVTAGEPAVTEPVAPSPAATNSNMDELVAKVLAKMNPEVLQAVTREILKPVVEALVKDELNKK
jgi:CheY-like chemotaxis protein